MMRQAAFAPQRHMLSLGEWCTPIVGTESSADNYKLGRWRG
ncbi:hypothetical protein BDK92_7131 [Micromonospora pisi]|uniref:Uncharacterized protein n=1 Tax=Micromonospora pisi TaxID=589240 RepID=A0A495JVT9_9ACTN|nr:hypothetical protein BDK92_7131 [Micromonospora pisi]